MFDVELVESVYSKRAWDVSRHRVDADAQALADTCESIYAAAQSEAERLRAMIEVSGGEDLAGSLSIGPLASGQLPLIELEAPDADRARHVVGLLLSDGYLSWRNLDGGAARSFFAMRNELTLVRIGGTTFTVRVNWPVSRLARLLPTAVLPSQPDWEAVSLPERLWPLYFLVRPLRLIRDKATTSQPSSTSLGPILATPESLIPKLLEFAEVSDTDHLIDLGCGDGRLVVTAAARHGCRAVGVENDPELAHIARRKVADSGVEHLVRIEETNAGDFDLGDATVILLFIPVESVAPTIDSLRRSGFGGRIVAHEQERLPDGIEPDDSTLLVSEEAITVAHLFMGL